jgi:ribosomal protein S12 methylthiotransferase accessory factor YcaO
MNLQSRKKIAHDRCVPPQETIARLESIIRPQHDYWLHEETLSEQLHWSALFIDEIPGFRSMGKGTSSPFSIAGALAEAAESLTDREIGRLPGYLTAHESDVENALPIADLVAHVATATPPVLDRIRALDQAKHWVDGYSLIRDQPLKVPLEYIRLISGPSGKATGNFIEEAIVHAITEIFERRAHITVLRNRMVVPTIDLDTIKNPVIQHQIEFVKSKGIDLIIKDLSFGGVLPCVGAYFFDPHLPADYQFHHFFKIGASFDRDEALIRTFTEYVQGRKADEFVDATATPEAISHLLDADFRMLRTQENDCDNFLSAFMFGMIPYRDASFLRDGGIIPYEPGPCYKDCLDDIAHALQICATLGKDFIVIDLTDPEVGFPVAQVIVPGYSDVLPYHPATSPGLFRPVTRTEVLEAYQ